MMRIKSRIEKKCKDINEIIEESEKILEKY